VIRRPRRFRYHRARALIAADVLIATSDWTAVRISTIDRRLADAGGASAPKRRDRRWSDRRTGQAVAKMAGCGRSNRGSRSTAASAAGAEHSPRCWRTTAHRAGCDAIDVAVGDQILIGRATFTIRGLIVREPGRGMGEFSLGPRVIIAYDDLASTGLLGFGSRARRAMLVKMSEDRVEPLVKALREDFKADFINTRSFRSTEDQVGRDFDRAENYLSLVGLIIVILGGIAVSSVTRVFILQKIRSIAVLKCLGARSGQIISVYILQVMTLGLAGSLLGVAMARGVWRRSR
jgi:predicted lysophospholipase L1 biosynthesis ABC-type transport system permease subunit